MKVLMISNEDASAVRVQCNGLRKLGVDIHWVIVERSSLGRRAYLGVRRVLKQQMEVVKPDVVHVQYGGVQAALCATNVPDRCVVTFHGTDLHGGSRVPNLLCAVSQRVGVWCSRFAARRVAFNILVSENLRIYLPSKTAPVEVVPTGVDFESFRPLDRDACLTEFGLDPASKWVLFCDYNHDPVKRRDLADAVVSRLGTLGRRTCLLLLNGVSHEKVPLYLNAADALLVTSDKEGSPNIVKEALACNTPVVSVDVGDVVERIGGLDGCEVCPRDPSALANALSRVLARRNRPNVRERVRPQIENANICRRLLTIYEKVCKKPRITT